MRDGETNHAGVAAADAIRLPSATHPFLIHTWSAARSTPQNPNECTHLLSETSRVPRSPGTQE